MIKNVDFKGVFCTLVVYTVKFNVTNAYYKNIFQQKDPPSMSEDKAEELEDEWKMEDGSS